MSATLSVLLAGLLAATLQGNPLRKSDLVRLLSAAAMSPEELAQLVRHNCLTFVPTQRDRNDFRALGADPSMMAAIDECARRSARRRTPPPARAAPARTVAPARPTAPPPAVATVPPAVIQVQRIDDRASAERSGFVSGGGQRGVVGALLPRAVVFEARDSAGAVVPGQAVTFTGINARIQPPVAPTDAGGQVRVGVTLGERVGSATVIASIGVVEKQVAFNVAAGPAAQLVLMCGGRELSTHFAIRADSEVAVRVSARDGFANPTPLLGLRAAVADARIFRVLSVQQDSVAGTIGLKPDQPGTTSLAVIANGMRQYVTVTVPPRAAPGKVDCR
ncbi:MAG TPA: Ig-like domain-containing protein [Gemmatimonadales bacterium]|jgi:hypothetical protein